MEKYYYENGEKCNYLEKESDIGSPNCMGCESFCGVDLIESWVKCEIYSAFSKSYILEVENEDLKSKVEQLENELASLNGGL